jgi:hypothetical protein
MNFHNLLSRRIDLACGHEVEVKGEVSQDFGVKLSFSIGKQVSQKK